MKAFLDHAGELEEDPIRNFGIESEVDRSEGGEHRAGLAVASVIRAGIGAGIITILSGQRRGGPMKITGVMMMVPTTAGNNREVDGDVRFRPMPMRVPMRVRVGVTVRQHQVDGTRQDHRQDRQQGQ